MATIHPNSTTTTATAATATSSRLPRRHSLDYSSLSTLKHSSLPTTLTHTPTLSLSLSATYASATTTPTTSSTSSTAFSLDALERFLAEQNFRQADEETRRLLIVLAGEAAIKRGYVFFSELQFISKEDLKAIDDLWLKFSEGQFGYSVQKKIWSKVNKDFTRFFMKVGWMKKLDTEIEQFNYRSFPNEFMWELNPSNKNEDDNSNNESNEVPPEGHLPLTNALRGTQLLTMIFTHPAFDEGDDEENRKKEEDDDNNEVVVNEVDKKKSRLANLRDRLFKPNYSF
ncbi:tetrapyrrole-binding protein, chloroplastic-like [Silene latifolia]|uniref:tetrapyrrole-binding protein, chloroplastic-like n=1 Tax=Silene latifolia TaxID=37657 RepID=UPI003D782A49